MCRFNMLFNDAVVNDLRPFFSDEQKMLLWMQTEMEHLMRNYAAQHRGYTQEDGEQLLSKLKALPNTPEGFLQLDTVLRPSHYTVEELREAAYAEKYGI